MSDTPPPPAPLPPAAAPISPAGEVIAPAWKRIVARLADFAIINLVVSFVVVRAVVGADAVNPSTANNVDAGRLFAALLIVLAVQFAWEAVATKLTGGTPMKRAFGIAVVRADDGADVTWSQAIVRWATWAIWAIVPFLSLLGPIVLVVASTVFLFTRPRREAVWDLVARTLVVERPR